MTPRLIFIMYTCIFADSEVGCIHVLLVAMSECSHMHTHV